MRLRYIAVFFLSVSTPILSTPLLSKQLAADTKTFSSRVLPAGPFVLQL